MTDLGWFFLTSLVEITRSPDEIFTKTLLNSAGICDLLKIKNSRSTRLDILKLISQGAFYEFHC